MDIPEEQLSEKYEMMDWMSAGSPENTGLLRERDRVSGKMTPSDAAAARSTIMWNFLRKSMLRMRPSMSSMTKSKVHWCRANWLSLIWRVSVLSGPAGIVAPVAVVRRWPPEDEDEGPGTRETEARVLARKRAPVV